MAIKLFSDNITILLTQTKFKYHGQSDFRIFGF